MRQQKLGELTVWMAGGTDREGGGDGPVVVLMHGFGAPGTDLVGLWRVLDVPRETRFLFPEAPLTLDQMPGGQARAWWPLRPEQLSAAAQGSAPSDRSAEVPEGMATAREQVLGMLEATEATLQVKPERLLLGGFSQGAMLATEVALHCEKPFAGLALLSTTLIAEKEWAPRMPGRAELPVLLSHGRSDAILAFSMAERLRDRLLDAGLAVRWVPFNGGHELPTSAIEGLAILIRETLYPSPEAS